MYLRASVEASIYGKVVRNKEEHGMLPGSYYTADFLEISRASNGAIGVGSYPGYLFGKAFPPHQRLGYMACRYRDIPNGDRSRDDIR